MRTWMVRAGRGGALAELFQEEQIVGIDFRSDLFNEPPLTLEREQIAATIKAAEPSFSSAKLMNAAGQLHRFLHELAADDHVMTYDPTRRIYLLGTLLDKPTWKAKDNDAPMRRAVRWDSKIARDSVSVTTRNKLGSIMTLFLVNDEAAAEVHRLARPLNSPESEAPPPAEEPATDDTTSLEDLRSELVEKSHEFIEDRIAKLDPYEMQDLVAGILRAMGYKTRVSPKGADRGVDIFASPDGLGLQEPRIFVEVKHRRQTQMSAPELRSFLGGRKPGDRCLYVSTGGFTKDARYEADRAAVPLRLIDLPALRELLLEHYPALDTESRQLVPLTQLYWPIETDE